MNKENNLEDYINIAKDLTIEIHERNLEAFLENNKITSWIVGLSSAGFALFVGKAVDMDGSVSTEFVIISIVYGLILLSALFQKIFSKSYFVFSHQKLLLYKLMAVDIRENPTIFKKDLETGIFTAHSKFISFDYLMPSLNDKQVEVANGENTAGTLSKYGFIVAIILFLVEYILIFNLLSDVILG